jgi:PCO_ADO
VYCRPINDQIQPRTHDSMESRDDNHSWVRYLHISEVPDQYSIGIFIFGPYARIPLHDHPGMCVLSRVLYGDLRRLSLDLARDEDAVSFLEGSDNDNRTKQQPHQPQQHHNPINSWFRGSWLSRMNSVRNKLPPGARSAFKNQVDHLQAPDVTVLYPFEGNLHEFVAGPDGAAVLDVLLPPYDNGQNRDCTFYNIHDVGPSSWSSSSSGKAQQLHSGGGKEPCFIVPTGQPENFHCISGHYKGLGEADDDSTDHEDEDM